MPPNPFTVTSTGLRSFQCAVLLFLRFELFRELVDPCDELALRVVWHWCSATVPRLDRTASLSRLLESVQTNREFVNEPFLVVEFRLQDFPVAVDCVKFSAQTG